MVETEKPFFSVVIPTYERPNDLKISLESLSVENQEGAPNYELIVTDDSHSDDCRNLVEKDFPNVTWGKGKQNGPAGNRNAGVARAQGEWIVFLDDDCIAQPNYLSAYFKAIYENPKILVFEGRIFADRPRRTWAEGCPENEYGGMYWTSNLCVNRKLFTKMGGLDEEFEIAYEDVDFAHRLKKRGIRSKFVIEASVCHPWRTLRQKGNNWKRKGYALDSLKIFLKKHPDAFSTHGSTKTYSWHVLRMIIRDLPFCVIFLKCRGIDILISQIIDLIRSALFVRSIANKK